MMTVVHPPAAPSLNAATVTFVNKDSHRVHTRLNPSLLRFPHFEDIGFLKSPYHPKAPLQDSYVRTLKALNERANLLFSLFRATGSLPRIVGHDKPLTLSQGGCL
jgi:hypothetical protein